MSGYERMMRVCFAGWRNRPVREITPAMIERKHSELGANSPAQANLAMRFLRSVLNYGTACTMANGKPLLQGNPVTVLRTKKDWFRIKRLLNHNISGDVTANYIQHDVEQLRAGMQAVTDYVLKAAGLKASADVVNVVTNRRAK